MKKTILLAGILVSAASQAIVIDDFTQGPYAVSLQSGSDLNFEAAANVPGGVRGTYVEVLSNPQNQFLDFSISNGFAISSNGNRVRSLVQSGYGFDLAGNTADLNWNLASQATDIAVNFDFNDLDLSMNIYIITNGSGTSVANVNVAGNQLNTFQVLVPLANFVGTGDVNDVDQLVFEFINDASGDYALASFEAVPEPASIAAVGLGLAALARRRRK
ncbi:MAG: hypothetical protein HONBIEJF_00852 [Fimbriimonadaceae bacterium]|nr:hypothetical protein [Fimbriimonadaceae bacterium]